jgi:membrane associated rhomboid family serine protease
MGFNLTPMVRNLLLLNIAIFILQNLNLAFMEYLPLFPVTSSYFMPHQFVTYMFLHDTRGWGHIFGNMFGLLIFGPLLERFWGSKKFLFFYFFTGIGAGILHSGVTLYETGKLRNDAETYIEAPTPTKFVSFIHKYASNSYNAFYKFLNDFEENPDSEQHLDYSKKVVADVYNGRANIPTVGASGAIFGILMAFGLLFPNTEIFLYFLFPIKAKYIVAFYGIYELYAGFGRAPGDSVAHFAHIGGMFFAYILIRYWGSQRNKFY